MNIFTLLGKNVATLLVVWMLAFCTVEAAADCPLTRSSVTRCQVEMAEGGCSPLALLSCCPGESTEMSLLFSPLFSPRKLHPLCSWQHQGT